MKIAHIIPSLDRGGAERVVVTLANDAAENGHDVSVITAARNGSSELARELRPEVRQLSTFGARAGRFMKYAQLVPLLVKTRAYLQSMDIIHVHLLFGTVVGSTLSAILGKRRPRIVETFHAAGMPLAPWKRSMTAAMARRRDAFVLMAEDPQLLAAIGARHQSIARVIPNGIDVPDAAEDGERAAQKQSLGLSPSSPLVGTIGRIVAEREPEKMLRLFNEVHRRVPQAQFVMGGGGPLLDTVRTKAQALGLSSNFHLPGPISNPLDVMKACDLYVSINVGPLTGIAGLEAAAVATPVIALQARSNHRSGHSDWIWSDPDVECVAARAEGLLKNPEERHFLARAQRQHVLAHFSAEGMSKAYLDLYESLASSRR